MTLDVRRTARGFRIDDGIYISSIEGGHEEQSIEFEPDGCRALWSHDEGFEGSLASRVEAGWANRGPPTDAELRALIAEPARADGARVAFARAWLQHSCPGGPSSTLSWERKLEGPIAPRQPSHAGPPRRAPATFWSAATLKAIGAENALLHWFDDMDDVEDQKDDPDPPPPRKDVQLGGVFVPPIGPPVPTFASGRFQLFEAKLPGHNGGRAIAVLDRTANRHRWAVVTRGCVQGTTVGWAGAIGDRFVGVTHSQHGTYALGDAILVIDAPTATAWAIQLPEAIHEALGNGLKARASLSGSILSLRVARVKAKIDLAPLLALIPAS
jgi:hypothetical protein